MLIESVSDEGVSAMTVGGDVGTGVSVGTDVLVGLGVSVAGSGVTVITTMFCIDY